MINRNGKRLIAIGSAVKASQGRVTGTIIRFTGPSERDSDGQYFDAKTDFYDPTGNRPVLWYHGWHKGVKAQAVGHGPIAKVKSGITIDAPMLLDHPKVGPSAKGIYQRAIKGELGWSSDSSDHLIAVADDGHIDRWPIVAASLAPATVVRDPKALVGVKALRQSFKAGAMPVAAMDYAKFMVLREAFANLAEKFGMILPQLTPRAPGASDVARESDWVWKMESIERDIERMNKQADEFMGMKAGRALSGANRDRIAACVAKIGSEITELQALLDETEPANAAKAALIAAGTDDDLVLALAESLFD